MQPSKSPIWTPRRRAMGNLLPSLFCVPLGGFGVWRIVKFGVSDSLGIIFVVAFPVVGWLALNFMGLYENSKMRALLGRRLNSEYPPEKREMYFVGIARANYRSAVDPHEDIAFLILNPDGIEIYGDRIRDTISKSQITGIRKRPNPHSLFFLGGWIVLQGTFSEKEWRIESREKGTLLGNFLLRPKLKSRLETWQKEA